jgi:hypothetical protein
MPSRYDQQVSDCPRVTTECWHTLGKAQFDYYWFFM